LVPAIDTTFLNPILGGHVSPNTSWSAEHRRWLAPGQDIDLDAG